MIKGIKGELAERSNAPHLKCGRGEILSEVRILHSPHIQNRPPLGGLFCYHVEKRKDSKNPTYNNFELR